ncbi:hypothetical protein INR49_014340 [Caranx melampygus]|nr:hypothetical protein INR49_014340 [Caranx melampygus]
MSSSYFERPDMSVSEPSDTLPVRGTDGSSMRLPLQNSGDHNGNAFFASSSSSLSSSSSSCLGELSPESLQNLSSINGGRTNSPLDYDMLEVTLMTMVVTKMDNLTDGVWEPKEDSGTDDKDNISVGKLQMVKELSESSDTSVSLYLDTNSSQYSQDSWNNNDNLTMDLMTNSCPCGNSDALNSGGGGKHDSSTARSESTEIPAAAAAAAAAADDDSDDNDDNEEEVSCLPLSSDIERGSKTTVSSTSQSSIDLLIPGDSAAKPELQTERPVADNDGLELLSEGPDPVLEVPEYDSPLDPPVVQQTEAPPTEDLSENMHSSLSSTSPARESKDDTSPEKAERCAVGFRPPQPYTSLPARAAKTKPTTTKTTSPPGINLPSLEAKRVSKAVLKNIKAKEAEDGPPDTPIKAVQEVPVTQGPAESVEVVQQSEDAGEESVVGAGEAVPTKASVEKPRSQIRSTFLTEWGMANTMVSVRSSELGPLGWDAVTKRQLFLQKVSSKLGPSVRQQGRGTRVDKVSGPAPPSGSGAGPPGQGRTGPRQAPIDGSMLGDAGQNGGGGCPTRLKQLQSQNLGLPKPRTTAERASTLPSLGPPTSNFKPTANQQSGGGSAGRPAPPATSKLPVKGLPTSLSSSSLGSNDTNGAVNKGVVSTASPAFAGPQASTGARPDELPSRSMCPVGSQSMTKPPGTTTPSDTAAPKLPVMRTRALSLQARTTATGTHRLRPQDDSYQSDSGEDTALCLSGVTKPAAQFSLQRSSSARLSRLNSTVFFELDQWSNESIEG